MYKCRFELVQQTKSLIVQWKNFGFRIKKKKNFGFESHIYQKLILVLIDDKRAVMRGIDVCTWKFCVH